MISAGKSFAPYSDKPFAEEGAMTDGPILEGAPAAQGFMPMRKALSAPAPGLMERNFSFGAGQGTAYELLRKKTFWEQRNPWRNLTRTATFVSSRARGDSVSSATSVYTIEERSASASAVAVAALTAASDPKPKKEEAVCVVDPFSTGALIAERLESEGFHVVRVLSEYNSPVADLVQESISCSYEATIQHNNLAEDQDAALAETVAALRALPWPVVGVLPGAETGVALADLLVFSMELRGNGPEHTRARRNKYLMGEAIRQAGIRAVKQLYATDWAQVETFLAEWNPTPFIVVVKPLESAGSDDVYKCTSVEEVRTAFTTIHGKTNGIGGVNDGALVQEFLTGEEFVVDGVSRDGEYKVVTIWEYDKRSVNDANFVYFGMRPRYEDSEEMTQLIDYAAKVVEALTIHNGPSHMEVKITHDGPCLVEMGARCHGGEGTWVPIAEACYGYSQVRGTVDSYFNADDFAAVPARPGKLRCDGREVFFVAQESGVLRGIPGIEPIRALPSFLRLELMCKPGDFQALTTDCFTRPGSVQLLHKDDNVVKSDYDTLRAMEQPGGGLFDFKMICPKDPRTMGVVVVVDPFSTGAQLAAEVVARGYRLVMVLAEKDSPVAELVVGDNEFGDAPTVQHDNTVEDQDAALEQTVAQLMAMDDPVVAVLPGAETGVLLADRLAVRLGTRNNGMELSLHRRNKYFMGETVRASGVRAVKQLRAEEWGPIADFLREWNPSPFRVIVKPIESAGTDDVFLCKSTEEVQEAFLSVNGKINGLGQRNIGVLVQEYLDGEEFVIDHVSRDGVHKCVAIWQYDKKPTNGAPFVYNGMRPRCADEPILHEMIEYARKILDALDIRHGPSHMEVKLTSTGPCLVEVGSRCHGGEGTWLPIAQNAWRQTMVGVTLDSYLDPDAFDKCEDRPLQVYQDGREVDLVSYFQGTVESMPGVEEIRALPSFYKCELVVQPGSQMVKTIDCFTRPGAVQLTHPDAEQVARDYRRIRELEREGLFKMVGGNEPILPPPPPMV